MVEKMTPTELIAEARELCGETKEYIKSGEEVGFIAEARSIIPALCDALEQAQATLAQTWEWDMYQCAQREIDRLRKELEAAQNAQRWIPVAERLPTKEDADSGGDVLAWYKSEYNLYRKAGGYALQIEYDDTDFVTHAAALTHWQPLPQPPKGED